MIFNLKIQTQTSFRAITALTFSLIGLNLFTQEAMRFEHLGPKEGMESIWYFNAVEDSIGFIWFAGHTGLTRYDGRRGVHYTNQFGDTSTLGHNEVFNILPVGNNELWCSTIGGGLSILNIEEGTFKNYNPKNTNWPTATTGEILQFSDSVFYFLGGNFKSLFKAIRKGDFFTFEEFPIAYKSDRLFFHDNKAKFIFKDKRDPSILWIIGNFRMYRFDTQRDSLSMHHEFEDLLDRDIRFDLITSYEWLDDDHLILYLGNNCISFSLKDRAIVQLFNDKENQPHHCRYIKKLKNRDFLLAYSDGRVFRYSYSENKVTQIAIQYPINPLPYLESIYESKNGDIYILGSGNSIMVSRRAYHTISYFKRDSLDQDYTNLFRSASIGKDGRKILFSKWRSDSLFILDTKTRFKTFVPNSYISGGRWGNFFPGTLNEVITHNGKSVFKVDVYKAEINELELPKIKELTSENRHIKKVELDSSGHLWVFGNNFVAAYDKDQIHYYADLAFKPDSSLSKYLYSVKKNDQVLFFNSSNEVYRLKLQNKAFSLIKSNKEYLARSIGQPVLHQNMVLIPSHNFGMAHIEIEDDSLIVKKLYTTADQLLSNNVYSLYSQGEYLWVSTGVGFQRIDPKQNKSLDFNYRFNLPQHYIDVPIHISGNNSYVLPLDNYIYYGQLHEIVPPSIKAHSYLTSLKINNLEALFGYQTSGSAPFVLRPHENNFQLGWSILTEASPHTYKVAFRLLGLHEDWVVLDEWSDLQTSFTNLSPKTYTFEVLVIPNINQAPFTVYRQQLTVMPRYYQTWWFRVLVVMLGLSVIYLIYSIRMNSIRREQRLLVEYNQQINQMRWEGLKSQMNPHFMYNNLNAIKSMILKQEIQEAAAYLSKFSLYIRETLNNSNKENVTLNEELNSLQNFIELENLRLKRSLIFKLWISDDIYTTNMIIPPMVLQPFVEELFWNSLVDSSMVISLKMNVYLNEFKQLVISMDQEMNCEPLLADKIVNAVSHSYRIKTTITRLRQFDTDFRVDLKLDDIAASEKSLIRVTLFFTHFS